MWLLARCLVTTMETVGKSGYSHWPHAQVYSDSVLNIPCRARKPKPAQSASEGTSGCEQWLVQWVQAKAELKKWDRNGSARREEAQLPPEKAYSSFREEGRPRSPVSPCQPTYLFVSACIHEYMCVCAHVCKCVYT